MILLQDICGLVHMHGLNWRRLNRVQGGAEKVFNFAILQTGCCLLKPLNRTGELKAEGKFKAAISVLVHFQQLHVLEMN